jgi:HSP20 family protein
MNTANMSGCGDGTLYPGEFIRQDKFGALPKELTHDREGDSQQPLVNIRELKDHFVVEMAVPGVQREDFDVEVNGRILSIAVLHKDCACDEPGGFRVHEFNYDCFRRMVELPPQADTEFMMAEYRCGILYINIQKSEAQAPQNIRSVVVVY